MALWCSGYHYYTALFNKVELWSCAGLSKSCWWHVGYLQWWESLTVVPARNKAKRLSSVNHITKTIHHLHYSEDLYRNSHPEVFLKNSQNSQENTCVRVSFLIKLQTSGLFLQNNSGDCFCNYIFNIFVFLFRIIDLD